MQLKFIVLLAKLLCLRRAPGKQTLLGTTTTRFGMEIYESAFAYARTDARVSHANAFAIVQDIAHRASRRHLFEI